jgi:hypothetical protein
MNVEHDAGYGATYGLTWVSVLASNSLYYLPTGATLPRDGMRTVQLRGGYTPAPGRPGPVGNLGGVVSPRGPGPRTRPALRVRALPVTSRLRAVDAGDSGIQQTLPDPVRSPWMVGVVSLNIQY